MEDRAMSHRKETEAMAPQPIEDWARIPWRKLERSVYRLQKRIYQASLRGNDKAVHNLQRLLMKSQAARTLAVRKVTQNNQGKRTAGIDGVKSVEPAQRLTMVQHLRHHKTIKPQPTRRVWIPKPGKSEQRPLGIPTMLDRAHQCLVKLALEPEWEARFEANSYGFRERLGQSMMRLLPFTIASSNSPNMCSMPILPIASTTSIIRFSWKSSTLSRL
jgi:RNA-directed DNA polymerase